MTAMQIIENKENIEPAMIDQIIIIWVMTEEAILDHEENITMATIREDLDRVFHIEIDSAIGAKIIRMKIDETILAVTTETTITNKINNNKDQDKKRMIVLII